MLESCIQRYPQRCSLFQRILIRSCRLLLGRPSFCKPHSFKKGSLNASEPLRARVWEGACDLSCCYSFPASCHLPGLSLLKQGQVPLRHPPGILLPPQRLSLLARTLQCLYLPILPSSQPFLGGVPHLNHSTQGQFLKFSQRQ